MFSFEGGGRVKNGWKKRITMLQETLKKAFLGYERIDFFSLKT